MFTKKQEKEIVLVLDIQSNSVGAGLFLFSNKERPEALYSTRVPSLPVEEIPNKKLLNTILKKLDTVMSKVDKHGRKHLNFRNLGHKKIDRAFCVLSTPWCVSRSRLIERDVKNKVITAGVLDSVIDDEIKGLKGQLPEEYSDGILGESVKEIEKQIHYVALNGYETNSPVGKTAKKISATVYTSVAPKHVLEGIENVLHKYVHCDDTDFHSSNMSVWSTIRDIFVTPPSYIVFDVAHERTNISVVEDGRVNEVYSVSHGERDIVKFVAKKMNVSPSVASSHIKMHKENALDVGPHKKVERLVNEAEHEWRTEIEPIIDTCKRSSHISKTVFMSTPYESIETYSSWVKSLFQEYGVNAKITIISNEVASQFIKSDDLVDQGVALQGMFCNKLKYFSDN